MGGASGGVRRVVRPVVRVGGARRALFNWLAARTAPGGRFVLRIEDTDRTRHVGDSVEKFFDVLARCDALGVRTAPAYVGDVLVAVNGEEVSKHEQAKEKIATASGTLLLTLKRKSHPLFFFNLATDLYREIPVMIPLPDWLNGML